MASKKEKNAKKDSSEVTVDQDADGPFVFSNDVLVNEVQRQVISVFEVFDLNNQKSVDVREVGTICRALDLCPTEADVHEIIGCVEESSTKGLVKMNTFVNHITKVICEGKYPVIPFNHLIEAFRMLDKDKKGTLEPAKFKEMLMREGEPLSLEEVDEMFAASVSKATGLIHWESYLDLLYKGIGRRR